MNVRIELAVSYVADDDEHAEAIHAAVVALLEAASFGYTVGRDR